MMSQNFSLYHLVSICNNHIYRIDQCFHYIDPSIHPDALLLVNQVHLHQHYCYYYYYYYYYY